MGSYEMNVLATVWGPEEAPSWDYFLLKRYNKHSISASDTAVELKKNIHEAL